MFKLLGRLTGKTASIERNDQYAAETRQITIHELGVPEAYYNSEVISNMENIRRQAQVARSAEKMRHISVPRMLAVVIYSSFQYECELTRQPGNYATRRLERLGITPEQVERELARDGKEVARTALYGPHA